jgi:hypothetical protein
MMANALCSASNFFYGAHIPKHAACPPKKINTGGSAVAWGEKGGGCERGRGCRRGSKVLYTSSPLLNDALFKYPVQQKDMY